MTTQHKLDTGCRCIGMALLSIALAVLLTAPVHAQRPSIAGLQAQIAALQAYTDPLQTYLSVDESVPAKPVLRVTAANLQVVNGSGLTYNFQNGVGNLIVGYDDPRTTGDSVCSDGAFTDQIAGGDGLVSQIQFGQVIQPMPHFRLLHGMGQHGVHEFAANFDALPLQQ